MKLYNRTKIDTVVLESLLVKAGRSVGAKTSGVVVQVNPSLWGGQGAAYRCIQVRMGTRWIETDGGYFKIALPRRGDILKIAETFFQVAQHEFVHIKDYQDNNPHFDKRTGARRMRHDARPQELRAYDTVDATAARKRKGEFDEVILNLAIVIEQIRKGK